MTIPVPAPTTPTPIIVPTIMHLPITPDSQPTILEPYHVDLLPEYGYEQREYLLGGQAEGNAFNTRILLRCPSDATRFTGLVIIEPSHIWSGTSLWRALNRWIMRNGHAWLEVDSQAPCAVEKVKYTNATRYAAMTFPPSLLASDFAENIPYTPNPTRLTLQTEYDNFREKWWEVTPQSFHIIASASYAVRSGELGLSATKVFLSGVSQTGGVTRRFLTHYSHLRLPNGNVPFDAFVPSASGGDALPDPPAGVKVVELLGEAEFQSVRWPCGVSGQARGTTHRREDSDSFRLYEVAGMAHRESRYQSKLDQLRLKDCELHGAKWSTFPNSFIYAAVFEGLVNWIDHGISPPASKWLDVLGKSDEIDRDEFGNARGGVRTLHTDVPISKVVAATPKGRPSWYCGSEWDFDQHKLKSTYGTVENYRRLAWKAIQSQMESGFLLPCDAEVLRRETVEKVVF